MEKKEYRTAALGTDGDMIVSGYAAVLEQPTIMYSSDGIDYREVIDKGAFAGCDMADVPFKYNHSDDFLVLARTRNKTLNLNMDERGLHITANLAPIQAGKDLYSLIQRGDIDKMSFGFSVAEDSYDQPTHTRRILKINKLWDVSAVDTPAYDGTSISARDYFTSQVEMEHRVKDDEIRKRLILMTF